MTHIAMFSVFIFQSTLPYGSDVTSNEVRLEQSLFQSTLPYGSDVHLVPYGKDTLISIHAPLRERLESARYVAKYSLFQSTLPYGSDSIKTKYFSINLNQAFIANKLNSNPQRFYFDVRKLLVSHSSSSCEPKLNFMFHITSH